MAFDRKDLIWIEPPLATGGMGQVWRVISCGAEGVRNISVVKRILLNYSDNSEFKRMFIDEAKITSMLHKPTPHPNIIRVLEFQTFENEYLLFLEYVNGPDLKKLQKKCEQKDLFLPISHALYIIIEVLTGLDHAHSTLNQDGEALNIIHRDISPQNILLSYNGGVKIIDWGIAGGKLKSSQTVAGAVKGKFSYMSPEQANCQKLTPQTDIYSTGVVLWELLTGKKLLSNIASLENLKKEQTKLINPPQYYNKKITDSLNKIVMKALAPRFDLRYKTAQEFLEALQEERSKNFQDFSTYKFTKFLKDHFIEEILNEEKIISKAEKKESSEIPPGANRRNIAIQIPTAFDRRKRNYNKNNLTLNYKTIQTKLRDLVNNLAGQSIPLDLDGKEEISNLDGPISYSDSQFEGDLFSLKERKKKTSSLFPLGLAIILVSILVFMISVKKDINLNLEMGNIYLSTDPSGAAVSINSKRVEELTPAKISLPKNKDSEILLSKKGYISKKIKLKLLADSIKRKYVLVESKKKYTPGTSAKKTELAPRDNNKELVISEKLPAIIKIHSSPSGASVYIFSDYICQTPCIYAKAVTGNILNIDIKEKGYEPYFGAYKVKNTNDTLNVTLEKENVNYGLISIFSSIPDAEIRINGRLLKEKTPLSRYKIKPGRHRVTITKRVGKNIKAATEIIKVIEKSHVSKNFLLK